MARFQDPEKIPNVSTRSEISEILQLSSIVSQHIKFLIITIGSKGVITIRNVENEILNKQQLKNNLIVKLYPTEPMKNVENVSGAGDSFASGVIHGLLSGLKESQCMDIGFKAAKMTLSSKTTVSFNLNSINFAPFEEITYKYLK